MYTSHTYKPPLQTWDIFIRLFHWCLVVGFFIAYFTQEQNYEFHLYSGYLVFFLVVARIIWGILGTKNARFVNFVRSPNITFSYTISLIKNKAKTYNGHNPLGAWMILLLLTFLLIVTISGVALDAAENRAGPLSELNLFHHTDRIDYLHNLSTYIMLSLIGVHITGVVITSKMEKVNLIKVMITGYKTRR